jgi:hypothetical protein
MEFLIGISLFLNIFLLVAVGLLVNSLQTEKKDLLDRLMAKDYKEYATFKHINETHPEPKVSIFDNDVYNDVYPVT